MNALLARLDVREVDWVGTSLGGLIGISLAGFRGSIIRKLVVNDIGPFVSATGLRRIGQYIGTMPPAFATFEQADRYFRTVLAPYGDLADEHWRHLTQHSIQWDGEREHYVVLCDPAIAYAFRSPWFYPLNLWKYWEAIKVPVLVLHGAKSDLLSADLTLEMRKRNPLTSIFRFDECGHVPPLMNPSQIKVVAEFVTAE
jgi:pimeloyl-ACP methyl ester carboxylesterase